jgi:hypothetical protein
MSYPYDHRTRQSQPETIPFKPLGADDGEAAGGSASNQIADMATVTTYTVNPIYGMYRLALNAWASGASTSDIEIKVRPWVDHGQTIPGNALKMFELGTATLVTALTIAATSASAGKVMDIVPGNSAAGANPGTVAQEVGPVPHGFGVEVDVNSNTGGTLDFEFVLQRIQ